RGERTVGEPDGHDHRSTRPSPQRPVDVVQPGWRPEHRHLEAPAPGQRAHRPYGLGESDGGGLPGNGGEVSNGHDAIQATGSDSPRPVRERSRVQAKQEARNASNTSAFGSTCKWPSSPREIARPGQKKSAPGVKKCGEPVTCRSTPSAWSASTRAGSTSDQSTPCSAATDRSTDSSEMSTPSSNSIVRNARLTRSPVIGSTRSAAAASAMAVMAVEGKR